MDKHSVGRYDYDDDRGMTSTNDGEYVTYDDYAALQAENAALREQNDSLNAQMQNRDAVITRLRAGKSLVTNPIYIQQQKEIAALNAQIDTLMAEKHLERWPSATVEKYLEATQEIRGLREIITAQGWQDIKDAPRDGTPYLSCIAGEPEPVITWWGECVSSISGVKNGYKTLNLYYSNFGFLKEPTHWAPLLTPPRE